MDKTRICFWIIVLGLANFLAFLGMYIIIGGDARNGRVERIEGQVRYLIQMRGSEAEAARARPATQPAGQDSLVRVENTRIYKTSDGTPYKDIGKGLYIYSGVHSILIWLTVAAVLLAMLTLVKDQLVTAMGDSLIGSRAVVHIFAAVVVCTTLMMTVLFMLELIQQLQVR